MRLIPNDSIYFRADKEYEASFRDESRMAQFFKVFGDLKVDRQNLYCTVTVSDFRSNHTSIGVSDNKNMELYDGLGEEDYGKHAIMKKLKWSRKPFSKESLTHLTCLYRILTRA
jgi:hypothetical protein